MAGKKHRVSQLTLDEISLVDAPANPGARVLLLKHDRTGGADHGGHTPGNEGDAAMDLAAIMKQLTDLEAAIAKLEGSTTDDLAKQLGTLKTEVEKATKEQDTVAKERDALKKQLEALTKERDDLKKAAGADPKEDVLKGLPKEIQARLEKAEAESKAMSERLAKMQEQNEIAVAIEKAAPLVKHLPTNAGDLGPLLYRVEKGATTADDRAAVEKLLKAANEIAEQAELTKELGASGGGETAGATGTWGEIEKKGQEIRKANPKLTKEQALDQAMVDNPELLAKYRAEQNRAA